MEFIPFYDVLKARLLRNKSTLESYIQYLPDLFYILTDLLNETIIDKNDRIMICSALGYFITPNYIIPRGFYDTIGYRDYMFISCLVLNKLAAKHGFSIFDKIWLGSESFIDVLSNNLTKSGKAMEEMGHADKILSFVGLL